MKIVHVEWIDSQTDIGWDEFNHTDDFDLTHTVGFLIGETEHYLVIANSYDPETKENNGRISIPLCCIKDVRTLCRLKI